ncbi:MAG: hypothetical protein K0S34_1030 [Bacillales bacterium]|jgi:hypothetical protein|nr:hypothetical protein [Bacillales bacterium]
MLGVIKHIGGRTEMPMEQEIYSLLIKSVYFVLGFTIIYILFLWYKYKENKLAWFLSSFFLAAVSSSIWIYLLGNPSFPETMASEEYSIRIFLATVLWILSIVLLLKGITKCVKTSLKKDLI